MAKRKKSQPKSKKRQHGQRKSAKRPLQRSPEPSAAKSPSQQAKRVIKKRAGLAPVKTAAPVLRPPAAAPPAVVGIGASVAGMDAVAQFLAALPADSGMALVVVLAPDASSDSRELPQLPVRAPLPVSVLVSDAVLEPNRVYVAPVDRCVDIQAGRVRVVPEEAVRRVRMPIDFFFRALAADQRDRAACMILSGRGSDGVLGLKEIKAQGGLIMVQDPHSTPYDEMPRAAIATGIVDHVLPVDKMPDVLVRYRDHGYFGVPGRQQPLDVAPDYLKPILALLRARTRFDFGCYKLGTLLRRIRRRLDLHQLEQPDEYVRLLREKPDEVSALLKDLLIGVTSFFRDPGAWDVLRDEAIRPLVQQKPEGETMRIWAPACSTGEEPYSIAMLLLEQLEAAGRQPDVQIFASDIDEDAVAFARSGVYPANIAADVSAERLRRFFTKTDDSWRVSKPLRELVVFAAHNLLSDPPFVRLDLITCRNLLIYLDAEVQKKIIVMFHAALREGGYLFLGNAETANTHSDLFEPISKKWQIYRRVGVPRQDRFGFPVVARSGPTDSPPNGPRLSTAPPLRLGQLMQLLVAQRYAPACALVNRHLEVLYLLGPVDRYLRLPSGEPATDLLSLAREGLRGKLQSLVREAIRTEKVQTGMAPQAKHRAKHRPVAIRVEPLSNPPEAEGLLLVTFRSLEQRALSQAQLLGPPGRTERAFEETARGGADEEPGGGPRSGANGDLTVVSRLQDELRWTREELQSSVEQLKASNEELQSAVEEATSVNEELQFKNEELETSKEELQALNEELTTVNSELEMKVDELQATNNDLNNLLASTDTATVFLDRRFLVKRLTPAATELLERAGASLERPLSELAEYFADDSLIPDVNSTLKNLKPARREVAAPDGRWYLRRVLPYRTGDDCTEGVVITLADVTELKTAADQLRAARDYAERIVETIRQPLVVLDGQLRIRSANRSFYQTYRTTPEETVGQPLYAVAEGAWDVPALRGVLHDALQQGHEFRDFRLVRSLPQLGWRTMQLAGRTLIGNGELVLLVIEDVTDQVERETARQALLEQERLGRELHDSVGQQITAISMLAASLHERLRVQSSGEAELAGRLLDYIEQAKLDVRAMSKGLLPVQVDAEGLMNALAELAEQTQQTHGIVCRFECDHPVHVDDNFTATHLYRIAQEAVHNAVKHAQAHQIVIRLTDTDRLSLEIRDDGLGMNIGPRSTTGNGLRIMRYRCHVVGGTLNVGPADPRGTIVACTITEAAKE